jgi:16S rRNA processing protein RimM
LRSGKRAYPQIVERATIAGDVVVVVVSGAKTIGEALRYVGCAVWADAPAPVVAGGAGVIGFGIFDRQGEYWGRVKAEPRFSLNQILEIEDGEGGIVYVPWHEKLIVKIDRRRRVVVIDPPEGLRDLNK